MTYHDNDEDLFNYDPDVDLNVSDQSTVSESDNIDSLLSSNTLEFFKAKTAASFLNAQGMWFDASFIQASAANKAAHVALDELTSGRFSLLKLYYEVEMNLTRKRSILYITSRFMRLISSSGFDKVKITLGGSQVQLDLSVVLLFINNNISVMNHACANLRAIYVHLANKLDIAYDESLLDDSTFQPSVDENLDIFDDNDELVAMMFSQMFAKSYPCDYSSHLKSVYFDIYNQLAQEGVLDIVKSMNSFNGEVSIC